MLIKPTVRVNYSYNHYDKKEVNDFLKQINFETEDISGKTLYLSAKNIMQAKLRDSGFTITRNKDKADVIVILNLLKDESEGAYNKKSNEYSFYNGRWNTKNVDSENFFNELLADEAKNYKYIYSTDLYKYLYKYEGNVELFNQISELFSSNSRDNSKIAMEMMSNANWEGNEIYLQELFANFWNCSYGSSMYHNNYKTSISFKGFLSSLDFGYETVRLDEANRYRELCKTEEHHNWVYSKFESQFKQELDYLVKKHKIKLDKIEYSIDKNIIYNKEEEEE